MSLAPRSAGVIGSAACATAALVLVSCSSHRNLRTCSPAGSSALAPLQAVRKAEEFIALNGYTDAPPSSDIGTLTPESLEWFGRERWVEHRRDPLEGRAYGYFCGRRGGAPGWTVVFRYKSASENAGTGRSVTMDLDGGNPRVEHVDVFLRTVQERL
jgi:hypothetical protein